MHQGQAGKNIFGMRLNDLAALRSAAFLNIGPEKFGAVIDRVIDLFGGEANAGDAFDLASLVCGNPFAAIPFRLLRRGDGESRHRQQRHHEEHCGNA